MYLIKQDQVEIAQDSGGVKEILVNQQTYR